MPNVNEALTDSELATILELRHSLHREPEISNQEWKTQRKIKDTLEAQGIGGAKAFHNTGLYVDIRGEAPGEGTNIAVRGDIDALPIQENRPDVEFSSVVPGTMHACGHDVHASVALGTALSLYRQRASFSGTVRVFFHPAEEAEPLGGRTVRDENLLDGFHNAVGVHVSPEIDAGKFGARKGPITKSADQFRLTFTGSMAHGAMPHNGVDAITMAAAFVNEIQKVVSREVEADHAPVITIGKITGGEATNIVCSSVVLEGTIRTRTRETRVFLRRRLTEIADGVATMHRGHAVYDLTEGEPPVVNDASMTELFESTVKDIYGPCAFTDAKQAEGSDDFGFYSEKVPSIYFWVGSRDPAAGNTSLVHTPTFGVADDVVKRGAEMMIAYVITLMTRGSSSLKAA